MSAHYDSYDYPSYWIGREYEHKSEILAISELLRKIKKIKVLAEYGAGYGRLIPSYFYRAEKIIISDPSLKLLKLAKDKYHSKKIKFVQARAENVDKKIKKNSVDVAIVVRVLHHIQNMDQAISAIYKTIRPGGYLILEFANKKHGKEVLKQLIHGNFTYPLDIFSKDLTSAKNKKNKTIPFINYHPDYIKQKLAEHGFSILDKRSVSNIRAPYLKKHFTTEAMITLERYAQVILSPFNFGPSVFFLAKKKI